MARGPAGAARILPTISLKAWIIGDLLFHMARYENEWPDQSFRSVIQPVAELLRLYRIISGNKDLQTVEVAIETVS